VAARWTDEQRHTLGRRSLILLILGIGTGLWSLIQTNALSGEVIGSLGEQAEEAGKKASLATRSSDSALARSAQAVTVSGDALSKSGKAETAASNALNLARGARREADSFEKRIVSATQKATEAESHLAEALQRAAKAEAETGRLTTRFADRSLSDAQVLDIANALKPFAGQEYGVATYWDTPECMAISNRIHAALQGALWKYIPPAAGTAMFGGVTGIQIFRHPDADDSTKKAADGLAEILNKYGMDAEVKIENPKNNPKQNRIGLNIGAKR
jgi:hypothetical protein